MQNGKTRDAGRSTRDHVVATVEPEDARGRVPGEGGADLELQTVDPDAEEPAKTEAAADRAMHGQPPISDEIRRLMKKMLIDQPALGDHILLHLECLDCAAHLPLQLRVAESASQKEAKPSYRLAGLLADFVAVRLQPVLEREVHMDHVGVLHSVRR